MGKAAECPGYGLGATRRNGRDRHGRQIYQCRGCRRRFICRAHAFIRNLCRHFYEFGDATITATTSDGSSLLHAWERLIAELLAR